MTTGQTPPAPQETYFGICPQRLVGPNTTPMLASRGSMTDEEWVTLNGGNDGMFFASRQPLAEV